MKTFKFVVVIILLISIFLALMTLIYVSNIFKKNDDNKYKNYKIKLIAFVYICAASFAVAILMLF